MFRFALYFFFLFPFVSYAQEKKQEPGNPILHLIANYPLTEDLLLKLEKIERECKNLSPRTEKTNTKGNHTADGDNVIEDYISHISSKPKLVSILKENNFTPRDFVIAQLAFQTTLNVLTDEENSTYEKNFVPSSNIEFAKEHMYRMMKILKSSF